MQARSFTALMPMSGMLRAALLPRAGDAEAEFELNEHAYAYAKGGEVRFVIGGVLDPTLIQQPQVNFLGLCSLESAGGAAAVRRGLGGRV